MRTRERKRERIRLWTGTYRRKVWPRWKKQLDSPWTRTWQQGRYWQKLSNLHDHFPFHHQLHPLSSQPYHPIFQSYPSSNHYKPDTTTPTTPIINPTYIMPNNRKHKSQQIALCQQKKSYQLDNYEPYKHLIKMNKCKENYLLRKNHKNVFLKYGFIIDYKKQKWFNIIRHLGGLPSLTYFNKMNTLGYHNLCEDTPPPDNTSNLLGLGLNFCLQSHTISNEIMPTAIRRFQRDVRLKFLFAEEQMDPNNEYVTSKKLYIKSEWDPPEVFNSIEEKLCQFDTNLSHQHKNKQLTQHGSTNLSGAQERLLNLLCFCFLLGENSGCFNMIPSMSVSLVSLYQAEFSLSL